MIRPWVAYQEEVSALFRSLGLTTSVETEVKGARATHRIDVLVSFDLLGLKIVWIVECKLWRKPVPKEKVLALQQILQDVGADRAFLFSERSFQPGAVSAARSTSISLTSLADLRDTVRFDIAQLQLRSVLARLLVVEKDARSGFTDEEGNVRRANPESFDESLYLSGSCLFLERAAVRGMVGEFPVHVVGVDSSEADQFPDAPSLAAWLVRELDKIEIKLAKIDMSGADSALLSDTESFTNSVRSLLETSGHVLTSLPPSGQDMDVIRYPCLGLMKSVGRASEKLRHRGNKRFRRALSAVMKHLIDTVYLDLTKPSVSEAAWVMTRTETDRLLQELQAALNPNDEELGS
jgi:hypothetical protein